jgi:hypothetical protein
LNRSGANSLLPALLALLTAALEMAICSVGAGVLAQPVIKNTAARVKIIPSIGYSFKE